MADAAMAKKEEPESQETPGAEAPPPPEAETFGTSLPAPSAPAAEIAQDELTAFREWQRQEEEAKAKALPSSPPKKQKTKDEEDMIEFEAKLVDLDINFADRPASSGMNYRTYMTTSPDLRLS